MQTNLNSTEYNIEYFLLNSFFNLQLKLNIGWFLKIYRKLPKVKTKSSK